ncbi:MAG: general secretion pathway protein GspK [Deltaproteobacteria bacterium]|nr:general secretion pathway protein GspK [Deltaproteobacteria bacterium]
MPRQRRWHKARRRRGAALVMVLGTIAILTVLLGELQEQSSSGLAAAIAERDRLVAEYHARSAVNLARLLIATEPTVRRALAPIFMMLGAKPPQIPVWEFAPQVLGAFGDATGTETFRAFANVDPSAGTNLGLGGAGRFEVAIVDEDSKLNVNVAARGDIISQTRLSAQLLGLLAQPQYSPMFEQPDADGQHSDQPTVCGALMDWADSDENLQPCDPRAEGPISAGTEDNFYQTIGLAYFRKNAAYDSLDELRLVRAVGDDFWATFVDPEPNDPHKRIMTVWGQGRINVNTANAQTLLALVCAGAPDSELCLDPVQAQAFIMGVTLARSLTMGVPLFGSPGDFVSVMKGKGMVGPLLAALNVKPVTFKSDSEMKKMVSTESKVFSIYADGVVSGTKRETRVRIQATIDFRQAQPLGALPEPAAGTAGAGAAGSVVTAAPKPKEETTTSAEQLTPAELVAAMASDPAGNVIYWRVE